MLCVAAACLEDRPGDGVTLRETSDAVRDATAAANMTRYNPDRRADHVVLLRAVNRLIDLGVLTRRIERGDLLRSWEDDGAGVGAGYIANREPLLLLDPSYLSLALISNQLTEDFVTSSPRPLAHSHE